MSKTYRPYEPDQMLLLPPSIKDWLPKGHLAHFVSDTVEELDLDLDAITAVYECEVGRKLPGWLGDYNAVAPHSALGMKAPTQFYTDWLASKISKAPVQN